MTDDTMTNPLGLTPTKPLSTDAERLEAVLAILRRERCRSRFHIEDEIGPLGRLLEDPIADGTIAELERLDFWSGDIYIAYCLPEDVEEIVMEPGIRQR